MAIIAAGIVAAQSTDVFAESITLTIPSAALSLELSPNDSDGFAESEAADVKVTSDAPWGYELSIKANADTGGQHAALNNADNENFPDSKIESITSSTADSSGFDVNTWGYKPSKLNNNANVSYQPGPTNTGDVLDKTNADGSTENVTNTYSISLAAKVDSSLPAGTYANTFIITAAANQTAYTITYDDNGGSGGPSKDTGNTYETSVPLSSTTPTRSGYEFKGWCSKSTSDDTCSGKTYTAGGNYSLTDGTAITLYAMWKKKAGNSTENFDCSSLTSTGATGTIKDDRDGNTYTVAKLADGLCWMTQNLRLGGSNLKNRQLTSADTDLPDGKTFTMPTSSTSGFSDDSAANVYVDSNTSYGGYYTYNAATAGTGSSVSSGGVDAEGSICPKGWRLPTKTEYDTLASHYTTGSALTATPANFVYAGHYDYSSLLYRGSYGYYWSSTAGSSTSAYYLYFDSSSAYAGNNNRRHGFSVRCVAGE